MERIFYDRRSRFADSVSFIKYIAAEFYGLSETTVLRTKNGKPYFCGVNPPLYFSLSHTPNCIFAAFSDRNTGIDAELSNRKVDYAPIIGKFPLPERKNISSKNDFLTLWTMKESLVKWLDIPLLPGLKNLCITDGGDKVLYENKPLNVCFFRTNLSGHVVTLCRKPPQTVPEIVDLSAFDIISRKNDF